MANKRLQFDHSGQQESKFTRIKINDPRPILALVKDSRSTSVYAFQFHNNVGQRLKTNIGDVKKSMSKKQVQAYY